MIVDDIDIKETKKSIKFYDMDDTTNMETCDIYRFIKDKSNVESFKEFLRQNNAINDLNCWIDIESYM
jgi:hypothetical protein